MFAMILESGTRQVVETQPNEAQFGFRKGKKAAMMQYLPFGKSAKSHLI